VHARLVGSDRVAVDDDAIPQARPRALAWPLFARCGRARRDELQIAMLLAKW